MTLIDDLCDGCGRRFDPMGDPLLTRHPEISEYAVLCATCEGKAHVDVETLAEVLAAHDHSGISSVVDEAAERITGHRAWCYGGDYTYGDEAHWRGTFNVSAEQASAELHAHVAEHLAARIEQARAEVNDAEMELNEAWLHRYAELHQKYLIATCPWCTCEEGRPYFGAQLAGTPLRCERCGHDESEQARAGEDALREADTRLRVVGPDAVTMTVCHSCQRNDRWQKVTARHYSKGSLCPGPVEAVTYLRAALAETDQP